MCKAMLDNASYTSPTIGGQISFAGSQLGLEGVLHSSESVYLNLTSGILSKNKQKKNLF